MAAPNNSNDRYDLTDDYSSDEELVSVQTTTRVEKIKRNQSSRYSILCFMKSVLTVIGLFVAILFAGNIAQFLCNIPELQDITSICPNEIPARDISHIVGPLKEILSDIPVVKHLHLLLAPLHESCCEIPVLDAVPWLCPFQFEVTENKTNDENATQETPSFKPKPEDPFQKISTALESAIPLIKNIDKQAKFEKLFSTLTSKTSEVSNEMSQWYQAFSQHQEDHTKHLQGNENPSLKALLELKTEAKKLLGKDGSSIAKKLVALINDVKKIDWEIKAEKERYQKRYDKLNRPSLLRSLSMNEIRDLNHQISILGDLENIGLDMHFIRAQRFFSTQLVELKKLDNKLQQMFTYHNYQ